MIEEFELLSRMNEKRMAGYPDQTLFQHAERDIDRIGQVIAGDGAFTREFYEGLNIGVMCARELEASDPEYCDAVYALLEAIRLEAERH